MFYSTDISVTLWILAGNRKARTVEQNGKMVKYRNRENEVLFVDLRQWGEPFEKKYIQFSAEQISEIAQNIHNWQREGYETTYKNIPEYCYSASLDEIEKKSWSLVPSKYIEFKDRNEDFDFDGKMKELQSELGELLKQEETSKNELKELFEKLGYKCKELKDYIEYYKKEPDGVMTISIMFEPKISFYIRKYESLLKSRPEAIYEEELEALYLKLLELREGK
jgi:type I restriction enzyme M protein